jgi:threonylcarbamoyladenosine tRNA methylthiotransferase MtaB
MHDRSLSGKATFAVATLGCKVNQADSEAISEQMSAAGFLQKDFSEVADVYIVNTCTVTHLGDRSSRQLISQARRRHPDALLVVTGCYAELNPQAVAALPGVDLVIGNQGKESLVEVIRERCKTDVSGVDVRGEDESTQGNQDEDVGGQGEGCRVPIYRARPRPYNTRFASTRGILPVVTLDTQHIGSDVSLVEGEPQPDNPSRLSPFAFHGTATPETASDRLAWRTRAQIKVQDGCDNRCTYCIVPYVRGESRSRSIVSIVEHVRRKVRAGFQEIVLTGVHLGDYHPDGDERHDLGDLIVALLRETDISRIRVSSLEPEDFRLEWLELWDNPRMCRHLHLPMQSGSDNILRRMARRYKSARYRAIVTTAKQLVPGIAISTDIITGFPGETDDDFEQTYQLAAELQFAKAHVFRFSPRQGTAAARMRGQIREEVKKARSERLLALNEADSRRFREQFLGQTMQVLIESYKHGYWEGLTDNYLRVELVGLHEEQTRNWQHALVSARLTHLVVDGIRGEYTAGLPEQVVPQRTYKALDSMAQ